jgi:phage-related minor tail protein
MRCLRAEEQNKFNASLVLTGNYAGMTASSLRELADISAVAGGNIGVAKDAVIELAASGKFTAGQIGMISKAAVDMEHATGAAVTDIVKIRGTV